MKLSSFRWSFILLLASSLIYAGGFFRGGTLGASLEASSGSYRMAAGTSPVALLLALLLAVSYVLLMRFDTSCEGVPLAGVFRRFVAFWLDFLICVFMCAPFLGIIPMVAEWTRTGTFHWTFERTNALPGDWFEAGFPVLLMFAALILYFVLPLLRNRATPGACIMGFRVVPDEGKKLTLSDAVLRTIVGFVAVAAWFITPFVGRNDEKGKLWHDRLASTHAVRLG